MNDRTKLALGWIIIIATAIVTWEMLASLELYNIIGVHLNILLSVLATYIAMLFCLPVYRALLSISIFIIKRCNEMIISVMSR